MSSQNIKDYISALSFTCCVALLSACAPPPASIAPLNQEKTFENRKIELKDLQSWKIRGGMAVKEGREGFSATMLWQQQGPKSFKIQLSGPLGSGKVKLINSAGLATLTDGEKKYTNHNAEQLLLQHTGYAIPINSLFYWVRGLPEPNHPSTKKMDRYGHLSKLQQQGWLILYQRFTAFKGFDVPAKLTLYKSNIKVKIVISRWL